MSRKNRMLIDKQYENNVVKASNRYSIIMVEEVDLSTYIYRDWWTEFIGKNDLTYLFFLNVFFLTSGDEKSRIKEKKNKSYYLSHTLSDLFNEIIVFYYLLY